MQRKVHLKTNLDKKLATMFVLSAILSCTPVSSEQYNHIDFTDPSSIKLANQIYLDTSQSKKLTPNTSIPYNLRQFNEADYFSSTIDDIQPIVNEQRTNISPQAIDMNSLPTPSQYSKVSTTAKSEPKSPVSENNLYLTPNAIKAQDFGFIDNGFAPLPTNNDFIVPTAGKNSETSFQQTAQKKIEPITEKTPIESKTDEFNLQENFSGMPVITESESTYVASTQEEVPNIDLDGKSIASVSFEGLKAIDEEFILSEINMQEGALFNQELAQQDLQKIYATGYFSDELSVEPTLRPDGEIDLHYVLKENIIVKNISVIGNSVISLAELKGFITPLKGKPQNLNKIDDAINKILDYYHSKGYILATIGSVDDDAEGNLNLTINEGIINKIDIKGNERTQDYIIERNILTKAGSVYNEDILKKDLAKVFSTQVFDDVTREITPSETNEGTYDISVVVKEKVTNSIGFGGGIDTGLGAFGSITFKEDNFRGKGQRLAITGLLGSGILLSDASIKNHMNYQAELSLFEPHFLNSDNSLMSRLYFREMGSWQIPLAIERRIGLSSTVEHKIKDYENFSTTFTAGVEHINLKEGDLNRITQMYNRYNLNIKERARQLEDGFFIHLAPGVKYSNLDNEECPRDGVMAQLRFNEAIGVTDFNHTNGRLSGMVTKFFPVFKKSSFSLTGKAGIKVHGDEMPEVMAYRLGGPYTIRGYRMNGVGSGESFVMGSAELATPLPFVDRLKWDFIKKVRLTFFVDAGKVFDPTISSYLYDRPQYALTAGVGLRLFVPGIGPISVDYGLPLTNPGDFGSENGYFTFGTGGLNMYNY